MGARESVRTYQRHEEAQTASVVRETIAADELAERVLA